MKRLVILVLFFAIGTVPYAQTLSPKKLERHERLTEERDRALARNEWNKVRKIEKKIARILPRYKGFFYCSQGLILEFNQGYVDEEIKVYKRAISRYRNSEWGYYRLGSVYYHRGIDLLEQANQLYDNEQYNILLTSTKHFLTFCIYQIIRP